MLLYKFWPCCGVTPGCATLTRAICTSGFLAPVTRSCPVVVIRGSCKLQVECDRRESERLLSPLLSTTQIPSPRGSDAIDDTSLVL